MRDDSGARTPGHLVGFPQHSSTAVGYACSYCYWRYDPREVYEVLTAAAFWSAQVLFERHNCAEFKTRIVEPHPAPKGRRARSKMKTMAPAHVCPLFFRKNLRTVYPVLTGKLLECKVRLRHLLP